VDNRLRNGLVIAAAGAGAGLLATRLASKRMSKGEQLEREMWANLKERNIDEIAKHIAPGFIGVEQDRTFNREQAIEVAKELDIGDYTFSDFQVSHEGPTMIVNYKVSVAENLEGKRLPAESSARQSVWLKTDKGWQWISHANLRTL
jgi:hypothetical protein